MSILVPEIVNAGDTVIFDVPAFSDSIGTQIDSASYALTWYARTNTNQEGATITGAAESDGWRVTLPSSVTTGFDAGLWTWQAIASLGGVQYTAGRAKIDLDYVEAAIRTLSQGGLVQEYAIGGRSLKRYKMVELLQLRDALQAEVNAERRAEKIRQGLGNPGLAKVRFV